MFSHPVHYYLPLVILAVVLIILVILGWHRPVVDRLSVWTRRRVRGRAVTTRQESRERSLPAPVVLLALRDPGVVDRVAFPFGHPHAHDAVRPIGMVDAKGHADGTLDLGVLHDRPDLVDARPIRNERQANCRGLPRRQPVALHWDGRKGPPPGSRWPGGQPRSAPILLRPVTIIS